MLKAGKTRIRLLVATMAVAAVLPVFLAAQDEQDTPLGDVARTFRKKNPPAQDVIDNDNLSNVMDQVESHRASAASLRYSIDAGGKSSTGRRPLMATHCRSRFSTAPIGM